LSSTYTKLNLSSRNRFIASLFYILLANFWNESFRTAGTESTLSVMLSHFGALKAFSLNLI